MTSVEREVWLMTLCDDLGGKTDAELEAGCRRYRQNPANRYFPTPGQLLEACRDPDRAPVRRYAQIAEEVDRDALVTPERAAAVIEATRKRYTKPARAVAPAEGAPIHPAFAPRPEELANREAALVEQRREFVRRWVAPKEACFP